MPVDPFPSTNAGEGAAARPEAGSPSEPPRTADLFEHDAAPAGEPRSEPIVPGAVVLRGFALEQVGALRSAIDAVMAKAPPRHLITPGGRRMSVAMTNCGPLGWVSDARGYRYQAHDPESGEAWPALPPAFAELATRASERAGFGPFAPDACLINRYEPGARLTPHQDRDESDFGAPIVSVSLGLPAMFLFGGARRADPQRRVPLFHGDVVVWGGPARLFHHGVLALKDGVHPLLGRQRINLTFRKAGQRAGPRGEWPRRLASGRVEHAGDRLLAIRREPTVRQQIDKSYRYGQNVLMTRRTEVCVFGTGTQARVQIEFALRVLPALRRVRYVGSRRVRDPAFEAWFETRFETDAEARAEGCAEGCAETGAGSGVRSRIELECANDPDAAVAASDVVITATPGAGPLFDAGAVRPGTHVNAVGADTLGKRELPDGLLARARLVVDDAEQARGIGETQWAPDTACAELGDLLTGRAALIRQPGDITVFDMTGLALQDLTVARLIQQRASAGGFGASIAWPW